MGVFFDTFSDQIADLWAAAHALDKPLHPRITWTSGIINGKGDFKDLQAHGIALAASIIIYSPVVPRIVFGWDTASDFNQLAKDQHRLESTYPLWMLSRFAGFSQDMVAPERLFESHAINSRYVSLFKSPLSINPWPYSLGLGYRAKYLGMQCAMTSHAVISDIDTICVAPCVDYLNEQITKDPQTFCITNWYDDNELSVGLCVYNVLKYRLTFLPLLLKHFWTSHRRDSSFVQHVRKLEPDYRDVLDLRLMNRNKISTERFYRDRVRKNYWTDETMHYHAWKGEMRRNRDGFLAYYQSVLDGLSNGCA